MRFKVPVEKDASFNATFFQFLNKAILDCGDEVYKWPDKITFSGRLGLELYNIIEENNWSLDRFNPTHVKSPVDKIIIEFTKPVSQTEERGVVRDDKLHDKIIEGIPGKETVQKIQDYASGSMSMNYNIERNVRPKVEIKLHR